VASNVSPVALASQLPPRNICSCCTLLVVIGSLLAGPDAPHEPLVDTVRRLIYNSLIRSGSTALMHVDDRPVAVASAWCSNRPCEVARFGEVD
jgi:hypothetical protein